MNLKVNTHMVELPEIPHHNMVGVGVVALAKGDTERFQSNYSSRHAPLRGGLDGCGRLDHSALACRVR